MSVLRKLVFPISLIYGLVVYVRNSFFDVGIFSSKKFRTATICVGNLSVGGTGKTPMIEYLIAYFNQKSSVAVLSRGYKRKSNGYALATNNSTVEDLGDEPFQIHTKFPEVFVAVDADRQNGIERLEKEVSPDVILLDDAFQHRKVTTDLNVLLTPYGHLYVDDWFLPTGNLRDSKSQSKRANFIIVTKCPENLGKDEQAAIRLKLKAKPYQKVLFSYLKYDSDIKSDATTMSLSTLNNKPFTLVTGIANATPLLEYLRSKDFLFEHMPFKDHHFFTPNEIDVFNSKALIVTTEKDYMRLNGKVKNMFFLQIRHAFLEDDESVLQNGLADFMKQKSY